MLGSNLTKRGKFRSIEMDTLMHTVNDPIWDDEQSSNLYNFPVPTSIGCIDTRILTKGIPKEQLYKIGPFTACTSPNSHIGPFRWAIDFLVPDGTDVLSSKDGAIIEIQEHSNEWGATDDYRDKLNYVTVEHKKGEYTQYCHLLRNSVSLEGLRVGDQVVAGQKIASVGKTGWTDRDHLHFIVFRRDLNPDNPFGFKSLRPQFV
jgi:murein DD-endopeptidase MepM/ murein hydrolase activator NlpD